MADDSIVPIISSSDDDALSNIVVENLSCFKICYNLFPKDYEFHKDEIVQLWLVHRFPESEMEETANVMFETFIEVGIFQNTGFDQSTGRPRYKLNNSFSVDFLEEQSNDTFVRFSDDISENTIHCSLGNAFTFEELYVAESLQTLLILHNTTRCFLNEVPRELFLKLPLLKALDLSHTNITELPSSIGNLKDLGYLNLSGTPITSLPNSICFLYQLQTLKLRGCVKLLGLPKDMRKLTNLHHLDVDVACLLLWIPPSLGDLTSLRTLPAFVVGKGNGCRITELKQMAMLSGDLDILRLENVSSSDEAKEAALDQKMLINKLTLQWTELQDGFILLKTLQPHKNLEELEIVGYGGVKFPTWIGNPIFSSLSVLNLHDCARCKVLPPLGKLPLLRCLSVSGMRSVKRITGEFCGSKKVGGPLKFLSLKKVTRPSRSDNKFTSFPQLRNLTLHRMQMLEKWTGVEQGHFPSLLQLTISGCPKLTALPSVSFMKSLQQLEISLCPLIESFPKKGLPTSLQCLVIVDCPLLKKQCHKKNGRESGMLAHICSAWIDYEQLPNLKSEQIKDRTELTVDAVESQTKAIKGFSCTPDVSGEDKPDSNVETGSAPSTAGVGSENVAKLDCDDRSVDVEESQTKAMDVSPCTPDFSGEDKPESNFEIKPAPLPEGKCVEDVPEADYDLHNLTSNSRGKKKVVINVSMNDEKSRMRAMKIAVSTHGVISAAIQGDSRNQIMVIGEGIDATRLTMSLRKKVGFTELVSVCSIEEKMKQGKKEEKKDEVKPMAWTPYQYGTPHVYMAEARDSYQNPCTIM